MSTWTEDELGRIADAEELEIAAVRHDGTLRSRTPIWAGGVERDVTVEGTRASSTPSPTKSTVRRR